VIIDTSALVAILRAEPEATICAEAIELAGMRRLSAAGYVELGAVIDRAGDAIASRRVDQLLATADIRVESVTEDHARIAREAFRDFGKGSGHPARLNFGDCFSYALAKATGEPLLFKGGDFQHTDVASVLSGDPPREPDGGDDLLTAGGG
jgi:ribonuclease VapC